LLNAARKDVGLKKGRGPSPVGNPSLLCGSKGGGRKKKKSTGGRDFLLSRKKKTWPSLSRLEKNWVRKKKRKR